MSDNNKNISEECTSYNYLFSDANRKQAVLHSTTSTAAATITASVQYLIYMQLLYLYLYADR